MRSGTAIFKAVFMDFQTNILANGSAWAYFT